MTANQCDIGLIGLGVMGENLALNMESKGFSVAVFNRTTEVTEKFAAGRAKGKNIQPTRTIEEFVGALKKPRIAMMMVKAGPPVDAVINELVPLLEKGDIIIDGGNSLFTDTQRRGKELEGKGIHFVGMGVSGGEEGALKGPSLMPGGSRESWEIIAPIFRKIAAQVDGEPCCRYMGPDGAGHYVKMVHNGIEYGDIQLICEAYAILKDVLGMDAAQLADTFAEWNKGELESYLIEITSVIFRKIDPDTGKPLVDMILDKAGQKGTGIWTLQAAIRQYVVISTINAAVEARVISSRKEERVAASENSAAPESSTIQRQSHASCRCCARRALRVENCVLRAGNGASALWKHRIQMEPQPERHRHHLARRLHHSREIFEPNRASIPARCRAAQSSARSVFHESHQEGATQVASRACDSDQTWRSDACVFCVAGVLRQLSLRSASGEPPASATRFLWRAHLRADR